MNPSDFECECDKLCNFGEYLDHKNCKYRKRLIVKLVEECSEIIDEVKIAKITSIELHSTEHENKCKSSCTIYVVLIVIVFTISIGIGILFTTSTWITIKKTASKYDYVYQTSNY